MCGGAVQGELHPHWLGPALAALAPLWLLACAAGGELEQTPSYAEIESEVFAKSCTFSACHGELAPQQGMSLMPGVAYDNIVGRSSTQMPDRLRVKPGDPAGSYLWEKLTQEPPSQGQRMPPGQPLQPEVLASIRRWIEAGSPEQHVVGGYAATQLDEPRRW